MADCLILLLNVALLFTKRESEGHNSKPKRSTRVGLRCASSSFSLFFSAGMSCCTCCAVGDDGDPHQRLASLIQRLSEKGLHLSPRPTPSVSLPPPDTMVRLNVYHLIDETTNLKLLKLGFGIFHTGVIVYNIEWSFGEAVESGQDTGLFCVSPGNAAGVVYKTLELGRTNLSPQQVDTILHRLENEWRSDEYHVLDHNCNHFTQRFCELLSTKEKLEVPSWCNRSARWSNKLVPKKLATWALRQFDDQPPMATTTSVKTHVGELPKSVIPSNWYARRTPRYVIKPRSQPIAPPLTEPPRRSVLAGEGGAVLPSRRGNDFDSILVPTKVVIMPDFNTVSENKGPSTTLRTEGTGNLSVEAREDGAVAVPTVDNRERVITQGVFTRAEIDLTIGQMQLAPPSSSSVAEVAAQEGSRASSSELQLPDIAIGESHRQEGEKASPLLPPPPALSDASTFVRSNIPSRPVAQATILAAHDAVPLRPAASEDHMVVGFSEDDGDDAFALEYEEEGGEKRSSSVPHTGGATSPPHREEEWLTSSPNRAFKYTLQVDEADEVDTDKRAELIQRGATKRLVASKGGRRVVASSRRDEESLHLSPGTSAAMLMKPSMEDSSFHSRDDEGSFTANKTETHRRPMPLQADDEEATLAGHVRDTLDLTNLEGREGSLTRPSVASVYSTPSGSESSCEEGRTEDATAFTETHQHEDTADVATGHPLAMLA